MGGSRGPHARAKDGGGTPVFGGAFSRKDAPPGTVSERQEQGVRPAGGSRPRAEAMTAPDAEGVSY